jgi:hypothetical protein
MRVLDRLNTLPATTHTTIEQKYTKLTGTAPTTTQGVLAPLSIIRLFAPAYKHVFISPILDYGQDMGYVHQCGLIVDVAAGEFLFYEPYGTYIKYERDYARPIGELLQTYYDGLPEAFKTPDGRIRYTTFHAKYGIEGIQNIILQANNGAAAEFNAAYQKALEGIACDYPTLHAAIRAVRTSDPIYKSDATLVILDVLSVFNRMAITDDQKYAEYWTTMLELYHDFNSKTCVSITLVELYNFFMAARGDPRGIKPQDFTTKFKIGRPNDVLFAKLAAFIEEYIGDDIGRVELNTRKICSTLN